MLPTLALFPHDPLLYDGVILIQPRYPERGIPSALDVLCLFIPFYRLCYPKIPWHSIPSGIITHVSIFHYFLLEPERE